MTQGRQVPSLPGFSVQARSPANADGRRYRLARHKAGDSATV